MRHNPFEGLARSVAGATASVRGAVETTLTDRLTLMVNHVLQSEPEATRRLAPHAGAMVDASELVRAALPWVQGTAWRWRVTPAGMLESASEAALKDTDPRLITVRPTTSSVTQWLRLAAQNDMSWLALDPSPMGEGAHAWVADLRWVIDHVRWDFAGDVERVLPQAVAPTAARAAERVAEGLKLGIQRLDAWLPGQRPKP